MNRSDNFEGENATARMEQLPLSLKVEGNFDFGATRPCIVPVKTGHEIQQQQQVSESQTSEAVVKKTEMQELRFGLLARNGNNNFNNRRNVNANQNPSNALEIASKSKKTNQHVFQKITDYENIFLAFKKARAGKTAKNYVVEFEKNLENELFRLQWELMTKTYEPRPLKTFTVRDPKTRKISASNFRDRVVHHAIVNQIGPIFEKRFIHDTYANRIGKGTSAAVERFVFFMRKSSRNTESCYVLKADISKYFDSIDHEVLLCLLSKRIHDRGTLDLVRLILNNHKTKLPGKGMPLGNLTSQFLANIYLAELDEFVKHKLKAKYYIRYVDDFVILSSNREKLESYLNEITGFLSNHLKLNLHPNKTKIMSIKTGITFLGFRQFPKYRLLKKSNQNRVIKRFEKFRTLAQTAGGGGGF